LRTDFIADWKSWPLININVIFNHILNNHFHWINRRKG
jgi:hypothetical protein